MKKIREFIVSNLGIILVILLGFIPLFDLLNPGLPITHDGTDHAARIANFYNALSEGVLIPRWAENLNWGYGHPVLMFLYPFSSYVASLFHLLGFSYVDCIKMVFAAGFVASGLTMYMLCKRQFNEYFAISSAILYMYAPYRFVDLYVRGAIGEHMAFIFPPLVCYFMFGYFSLKSQKIRSLSLIGISFSTALLLLSHNAISIMFLPFFVLYALFLVGRNKDFKKLIALILAIFLGFLLSAFFTLPAFFEGKFTLRDIVTGDEYKTRFINPISLLFGDWNYGISGQFSVQVGLIHILGVILSCALVLSKSFKKLRTLFIGLIFLFLISLFLTIKSSEFIYDLITTFKKFQFPWRFLTLSVFTSSILASSIFIVVKSNKIARVMLLTVILLILFISSAFWRAKEYKVISDSFYNQIYKGTTDTGESAPIWSIRFMEKEPLSHAEFIDGNGHIKEIERTSVRHRYEITTFTKKARIRENTLYFPGWKVYVNGSEVVTQFQDPNNRGLITFQLNSGRSSVDVVFEDTKLRLLSNLLSLSTFVFLVIGILIIVLKHEIKKK